MNHHIVFDQTRPIDVIPMGRIALDFNPLAQDYYKPSSEVNVYTRYIGGSPANISVGLAHLGKKVGFIGKIPDDRFGDFAINFFNKEGIDTSHITRCLHGEKMGLAFTEILSETESSILMYRENVADLMLSVSDIDEAYIKNTKALLVSGTALSVSPSREAVLKAIAFARKNNTLVIFDIDYRPQNWKCQDEIT
ncbi:MAG TPA: PfkB family carbohydrate kinase, partial [Clostridia bacterium]|nr:PfkB family carbohydrate kinase [Clostridia bacterium]